MKILYCLLVSILVSTLYGQNTIPNHSFENWTTTTYQKLDNYTTEPAFVLFVLDTFVTSRDTDRIAGNYSIKMQTVISGTDTVFGFFTSGDFDTENGFPYSQRPDSLVGYYKCDVKAGDSAFVLVRFSTGGVINSFAIKEFTGTQSIWTRFSIPLNLLIAPDSMFIAGVSSNAVNEINIQDGSMLMLDSLHFVGTGITQQIVNGDFENWSDVSYEEPDDWSTINAATSDGPKDAVVKTTDSHSGSYALRFETIEFFGDTINFMTNGSFGDTSIVGGHPFSIVFDTLVGYYKYSPIGLDTAGIALIFSRNGNSIGNAFTQLSSTSSYTKFSVPFVLPQTPDSLRIDLYSSTSNPSVGSTLFIDNLKLKSIITSIDQDHPDIQMVKLYPNPANQLLNLQLVGVSEQVEVQIIDQLGRLYQKHQLNVGDVNYSLDISRLKQGQYYLRIIANDKYVHRTFIKQ